MSIKNQNLLLCLFLSSTGCVAQEAPPQSGREFFRHSLLAVAQARDNSVPFDQYGIPFVSLRVDGDCTSSPIPALGQVPNPPSPVINESNEGRRLQSQSTEGRDRVSNHHRAANSASNVSLEERNINAWMAHIGILSGLSLSNYERNPLGWGNSGTDPSPESLWQRASCRGRPDSGRFALPESWGIDRGYISSFHINFFTNRFDASVEVGIRNAGFISVYRSSRCTILQRVQPQSSSQGEPRGRSAKWQDVIVNIIVAQTQAAQIGTVQRPMAGGELCALRARAIMSGFPSVAQLTDTQILDLVPQSAPGEPNLYLNNVQNFGIAIDSRVRRLAALLQWSDTLNAGLSSDGAVNAQSRRAIEQSSSFNDVIASQCNFFVINSTLANDCALSFNKAS